MQCLALSPHSQKVLGSNLCRDVSVWVFSSTLVSSHIPRNTQTGDSVGQEEVVHTIASIIIQVFCLGELFH